MFLHRNQSEAEIAIEGLEDELVRGLTGLTKGDGISREEN